MSQQYQQPGYPPQGQAIPLQQQPQMSAVPTPAPAASTSYVVYPAGDNATKTGVKPEPWQYAVRGIQIVVSIIVLGLSAYIIHGAYMDPFGFAIAVSVLTWLGLGFILASQSVASLQTSWRIFVVIAIDAFLTIMWLSCMGSTAHMRASFKYRVSISGCYNDGSLIDSTTCFKMKRDSFVAGKVGLASMTAVACISALNFILFAVMTVLNVLAFLRSRSSAAPAAPIVDGAEKQQTVVAQPAYTQPAPVAATAPVYPAQGAAIPAAVPVQQPIQPQYTGGFVQQPVQPQYTGGTYGQQQPIPAQHTGSNFTSPTPPTPQGFHEAPGSQPFTPQYTGNYPSPTTSPAPVQAYAQELPTQHTISPPNSPPPQQGYTHHPQ
ncbi:hypothetical protein SAPIO_CDS8420 [Scedosporium apiospermum]|uniref:MARVEL domain-containing protein n=1 Tax=Pseudallescheria apiosperma TaxID=563466 RepID=A0A084FZK6_PSEDA|nr:uncharacterized protein SAPIO_CDS8420 [Scedosporium apiospermum]KEZ40518.1 hypothetical protein SAPIO_CDS8420 [Scedosporium apiospermum]